MEKKLYRIREGRKLLGVCGGLAEYFSIDATVVRLVWALLAVFFGSGILLYLICALIIPEKPF